MHLSRALAAAAAAVLLAVLGRRAFSRQAVDSTAQGVALMRRVGWFADEPVLRVNDPASICFVSRGARLLLYSPLGAAVVRSIAGFMCPGAAEQVVFRTRFYDELINASVASRRAKQVVIMGAGFVTYGHRLEAVVDNGAPVYEVDLPAVQAEKLFRLDNCVAEGRLVRNPSVRHVPIDFATQTVSDTLQAAGFDPLLPTIFAWEGVSMYVPEAGVRATLKSIRSVAAPGSVLAFSHIYREHVEGDPAYAPEACLEGVPFMRQAKSKGEPWLFGIGSCRTEGDTKALEQLLAEYGFALEQALTAEEASRSYFTRPDGTVALRVPRGLVREAVARVATA